MGKQKSVAPEQRRTSLRLQMKLTVDKKKAPPPKKPAAKAKKAKPAENGNNKAEEPKAEATEAK